MALGDSAVSNRQSVASALASAFLAGPWTYEGMVERGAHVVGGRAPWLLAVVRGIRRFFPHPPVARMELLTELLATRPALIKACRNPAVPVHLHRWLIPEPSMGQRPWPVPELSTQAEVARWLGVTDAQLGWLADGSGFERTSRPGQWRRYRYVWIPKRAGGKRLLEQPGVDLGRLQRQVLHGLLDLIPPHDAARGFVRGRGVRDFAEPHVGQAVVVHMDLEDFFHSVRPSKVWGVFRAAGYPDSVTEVLAGLCTNRTPGTVVEEAPRATHLGEQKARWRMTRRLTARHLPQGAPTSPALANLAAYRLDVRLSALAAALGARYTRYADDLAFSGGASLLQRPLRLVRCVAAIVREEGFAIRADKTRVMHQGQQQRLAGVVVNAHPTVPREDYERLKAVLHLCRTRGPTSQNTEGHHDFRAHLLGRIAWVSHLHPSRGARLRATFDRITWD
ncbi:reverse transcriptase family protein [Myxococcus landrumensis]|uniref:RNA-directed DNA polymerase n=1 Tax=Myxococcus landrumensis TaxID=2813577 RepID=A0ABX7N5S2_9BACT|nr:reverse transcriptase family protein [Myxococcus landrumus]QSQ14085.1 RNA-directed DNA polymerase [Myxococcus landrumus]